MEVEAASLNLPRPEGSRPMATTAKARPMAGMLGGGGSRGGFGGGERRSGGFGGGDRGGY